MLFQHAGELSEFSGVLSELAVPVEECAGSLPRPADLAGARLVIVCGNRLLEKGAPNLSLWPRTIAVIDDASKTLVSQLSRIGAAMVIRRPIHPRALRLLLLHEIYRGPERRIRQRVLIGNPIRLSGGLFRPHATLLDLSPNGARLELANAPAVGSKIRILIGKDLTKGKPIKLQAKVVRLIRSAEDSKRGESEIGVAILDANRQAKIIKAILNRFALGPASWSSKTSASEAGATTASSASSATLPTPSASVSTPVVPATQAAAPNSPTSTEQAQKVATQRLPPSHAQAAQTPTREIVDRTAPLASKQHESARTEASQAASVAAEPVEEITLDTTISKPPASPDTGATKEEESQEEPEEESKDRRREARIPYDQRIVALGEEAARVLVGRDLSRGGMRIAETPSISIGDVLRVALHSGTQTEPVVIVARALRDDGEDGLILSFDDLSPTQSEDLEKIIESSLPVHASAEEFIDPESTNPSIVMAEMIETLSSNESSSGHPPGGLEDALRANVESDAEIDAHLDSVFDTGESI